MNRLLIAVFMSLGLSVCGIYAQNTANPFDLRFRLPATEAVNAVDPDHNPFDVVAHRSPEATASFSKAETGKPHAFFSIPRRNTLGHSTMFGILVLMLMLFTASVGANRTVLGKSWQSFLNENSLSIAQRDATGLAGNTPYYLLYGNFLLNAGLFAFLIVQSLSDSAYNNLSFLLLCITGAFVVFLSKHLFLRILGWLFPVSNETSRYNFLITIFNCVLGVFLVPFNFLIAFLLEYKDFLVFWAIGLAIIFYGYRSVRALSIGSKYLGSHFFHFFLYLCTVEIAPLVVLIKLISLQVTQQP